MQGQDLQHVGATLMDHPAAGLVDGRSVTVVERNQAAGAAGTATPRPARAT